MRRRTPQHFYAFDILWLDGKDLRACRFLKRRKSCGVPTYSGGRSSALMAPIPRAAWKAMG